MQSIDLTDKGDICVPHVEKNALQKEQKQICADSVADVLYKKPGYNCEED